VVIRVSKGPAATPPVSFAIVPQLLNDPQASALTELQDLGLSVDVLNDYSVHIARGHVMGSLPHAGQSVPSGSQIVLLVSSGPSANAETPTGLPLVVGLTEQQAVSAIQANGLTPRVVTEVSPNVAAGLVIDQLPSEATLREPPPKRSSLVWLWVLLGVLLVSGIAFFAFASMGKSAIVPDVTEITQPEAQGKIVAAGFKLGSVTTSETGAPEDVGNVLGQSPAAGTEAKEGSAIDLIIGGSPAPITVPSVVGQTQDAAQSALAAAGLTFRITNSPSTAVPSGSVILQTPVGGQQVAPGTSVGLTVSTGAGNVPVPAVVGQTQSDAQAALKAASLSVKINTAFNAAPEGEVYDQSPAAGTIVAPGTVITISVSSGPKPAPTQVTVPDVINMTKADAQQALTDLGFEVSVSQVGTFTVVGGQVPSGGTKANKGSTVKIAISK
jgi:beta-lactam-binding protein with PASTA domain